MNLRKRLTIFTFKAAIILTMVASLAVPNSSAFYQDQEDSSPNTFGSSDLDIEFTSAEPDFAPNPIMPEESATRSALISNVGNLPINYDQTYQFVSGDETLCQNLTLTARYNYYNQMGVLQHETIYTGPLTSFQSVSPNSMIPNLIPYYANTDYADTQHWFDYQVSIIPNSDPLEPPDPHLGNKTCNFDILASAWMKDGTKDTAFYDHETLNNTITTGSWAKVSGVKFEDLDKDGEKDAEEPLLQDWTIFSARQVDQFQVEATDSAHTSITLQQDKKYIIRSEGTFDAGDQITADTKYSIRTPNPDWTDTVQNYESYGPTLLDLQIDGSSPNWGVYRDDHTYWTTLTGDDATHDFEIYDIYKPNNSGALTVTIFEVIQETQTDENGHYELDLSDITTEIIIGEIMKAGWTQSLPDYPGYYFIPEPDIYEDYDFGNYQVEQQRDVQKLVINEVYYDVDTVNKGDEDHNEWIELYNPTDHAIDLKGWYLKDGVGTTKSINPQVSVPSQGFVLLAHDNNTWVAYWNSNGAVTINFTGSPVAWLNNDGDTLTLYNPDDQEVDFVAWEGGYNNSHPAWTVAAGDGESIVRSPLGYDTDQPSDWVNNPSPNPGTNPHSHIVLDVNQADNNLLISFSNATGFDLVRYTVQYEHKVGEETITDAINGETTKLLDQTNLAIDPLYLGTCSTGGTCTPHTDITNMQILLQYKNGQDILGTSTVPYTWINNE